MGWGKASRGTQSSVPGESPARGEPCQAARAQAGTGRGEQAWKGDGRERPRWKRGSREEKASEDAQLNRGVSAKEQGRNKDDLAWSKALREGRE